MTHTPPPSLAFAQLASIRDRGERPSQFTARTIRDDYTAMLAEIARLRAELEGAEDLERKRAHEVLAADGRARAAEAKVASLSAELHTITAVARSNATAHRIAVEENERLRAAGGLFDSNAGRRAARAKIGGLLPGQTGINLADEVAAAVLAAARIPTN